LPVILMLSGWNIKLSRCFMEKYQNLTIRSYWGTVFPRTPAEAYFIKGVKNVKIDKRPQKCYKNKNSVHSENVLLVSVTTKSPKWSCGRSFWLFQTRWTR